MTNGLVFPQEENQKTIKTISVRVGQLRSELVMLEKIIKKILDGRKLTNDEKDTINLLAAIGEDTGKGWLRWNTLKRQLDQPHNA